MSPGPCTPNEAGICLELVKKNKGRIPLLGVCLGHQAIGQAFGGKVVRATPQHGKVSEIKHSGTGVFHGINGPLRATRSVYPDVPAAAHSFRSSMRLTR